jgi:FixJ family two-component response regulator
VSKGIVHVVEDDRSVRSAVTRLLKYAGIETRSYASAAEYLVADQDGNAGCIVLDVGLPGLSGMDLQAALAKKGDAPPIVFITGRGDIEMGVRAMKGGAIDFLTKPVKKEALLAAVNVALTRDAQERSRRDTLALLGTRFDRLTAREREVLGRVVRGRVNKQIADELGIAIRTVKAHRASIMKKMEVASLAELVTVVERLERATA